MVSGEETQVAATRPASTAAPISFKHVSKRYAGRGQPAAVPGEFSGGQALDPGAVKAFLPANHIVS